jgi:hypothetical protein
VFTPKRTGITLTGVWRGSVTGNYDKQYLAEDGLLNVDYYLIVDAKRGEALVFEQFGSEGAGPQPLPNSPTWSYVTCGRSYQPSFPAQVHTFVKVSNSIEDARALLNASTGQTFNNPGELVLSDVWQQLVDTKYFDDPGRSLAYAGALFKPFTVENVRSGNKSLLAMDMVAEYRGSGQTALQFSPGVAIHGTEHGKFLGVQLLPSDSLARVDAKGRYRAHQSVSSGDYLIASPGLGGEATVAKDVVDSPAGAGESTAGNRGILSYSYDKIVIGPLAADDSIPTGKKHIPSAVSRNHRSKNHGSKK